MKELVLFITIMVLLWVVWFASGGPEKGKTDRPFLKPPAPVDTGATYGPADFASPYFEKRRPSTVDTSKTIQEQEQKEPAAEEKEPEKPAEPAISIFKEKISFGSRNRPKETDPQKEYIEIVASRKNTQPIPISALSLKSAVSGRGDVIETGTYLPLGGQVNSRDPIYLSPGERAYIITGRSPIGMSFRVNKCIGYFGRYQSFSPTLPRECPLPEDEVLPHEMLIDNACMDFVEGFRRCEAHVAGFPPGLSAMCQNWVSKYVHYNGCLELHRDDPDFMRAEWRVYLARDNELWRDRRETILLLDETGKTIDSFSY